MNGQQRLSEGHVFISYVREDTKLVDQLATELSARGATIWLDRSAISPGEDWRAAIRRAIEHGAYFVACFSANYAARGRTHMNEELEIAIDELRKRPRDRAWFLPVLLDPETLPHWEVDAVRTLGSFQQVWLYDDWHRGVKRLLDVISPPESDPSSPDPAKNTSQLTLPVSASYLTRQELFGAFIDAALAISDPDGRSELRHLLQTSSPLPTSMLYTTPSGSKNWLRLCEDPSFTSHHRAVNFWRSPQGSEVARTIIECLGRPDFDYISLGCGDGRKDAHLLEHWLRADADLTYYPCDVSYELLVAALSRGLGQLPKDARERLHIKGVVASFSRFAQIGQVFRQGSSPNVISLLGNNLAALDNELNFLAAIRERMSTEDLLILEARLTPGVDFIVDTNSEAAQEFYFGPLQDLGVPFDPGQISVVTEQNLSVIKGTTTQIVKYGRVELDSSVFTNISLARLHAYQEDSLLRTLSDVGLELVFSQVVDSQRGSPALVCIVCRATIPDRRPARLATS